MEGAAFREDSLYLDGVFEFVVELRAIEIKFDIARWEYNLLVEEQARNHPEMSPETYPAR